MSFKSACQSCKMANFVVSSAQTWGKLQSCISSWVAPSEHMCVWTPILSLSRVVPRNRSAHQFHGLCWGHWLRFWRANFSLSYLHQKSALLIKNLRLRSPATWQKGYRIHQVEVEIDSIILSLFFAWYPSLYQLTHNNSDLSTSSYIETISKCFSINYYKSH